MSQPNGTILIPAARSSRNDVRMAASGLITENYPRSLASNTQILIGGTAYGALVGLRAGDVISNAYFGVSNGGTGTSLFKVGIYSANAATQYATGTGTNADFNSLGQKVVPISWTCPADGGYAVIWVATAATTLPTLVRSSGNATSTAAIATGVFDYFTAGTGLANLPAAGATLATTSAFGFWVGLG